MEQFIIYISGIGYYIGNMFKNTNTKGIKCIYNYTTNNPIIAKKYSYYGNALMAMKALKGKCDNIPSCKIKLLSECEIMKEEKTIILVRKGINGFKYSACDKNGYFLNNFNKLSDIRKYWEIEIKLGYIEIVRELNKKPNGEDIENE